MGGNQSAWTQEGHIYNESGKYAITQGKLRSNIQSSRMGRAYYDIQRVPSRYQARRSQHLLGNLCILPELAARAMTPITKFLEKGGDVTQGEIPQYHHGRSAGSSNMDSVIDETAEMMS
ncbi:hypothetical protein NQ318_021266 [Aromia moschata]|uniref:Uncharacterized protein n=1 Tax=Aromia moschata TaxID=1265417 RepID=A0AAV8ZCL3_9CUCU|nr:hypothetical protein NQ318_021266 [Aromia moschata]